MPNPETFDLDAHALAGLRSAPPKLTMCDSCKGPLDTQTGECNCSS